MDSFGRLLHGAVGHILDAVVGEHGDEAISNHNYYSHDAYHLSRFLQEESANATTTAAPTMMGTALDEMAGAGAGTGTNATTAMPTLAPTADPNATDLLEDVLEVPDPFNATAGLTDTEVIRTTCKLYGSIFLILFIVFLVVRKAFPGAYTHAFVFQYLFFV